MTASSNSTLSVSEIAEALKVSRSTVYRYIRDGRLSATKTSSGRDIVRMDRFVTFVAEARAARTRAPDGDRTDSIPASSTPETSSLSRRQLLLSGLAIAILGQVGGNLIYDFFGTRVAQRRAEGDLSRLNDQLIRSLFGGLADLSWSAGLEHMRETYDITKYHESSAFRASVDLGAAFGLTGSDWLESAVHTDGFPGQVDGDTDLVTTGSPISDPVTARLMEYSGPDRYHLQRPKDPLIDLPVSFQIDAKGLPIGSKMATRYVAGEVREMPNWQIAVRDRLLPPPKLSRDRWIQSDYLTVSRLPNLIDPNAFIRGSEAIVVAGTHGIGTEAIGLLLGDNTRLAKIQNSRMQHSYFQALVEVPEIDHGNNGGILRSTPMSLGDVLVESVELDLERIVWRWLRSTTE